MIAWLAAAALAAQAEGAPPPEGPGEIDTDAPGAIEEVVVEASRMRLTAAEMPVNTTILSELDVRESAWQPADQILRQVPGFSLLRSADSIAAAPTTTSRASSGQCLPIRHSSPVRLRPARTRTAPMAMAIFSARP